MVPESVLIRLRFLKSRSDGRTGGGGELNIQSEARLNGENGLACQQQLCCMKREQDTHERFGEL